MCVSKNETGQDSKCNLNEYLEMDLAKKRLAWALHGQIVLTLRYPNLFELIHIPINIVYTYFRNIILFAHFVSHFG